MESASREPNMPAIVKPSQQLKRASATSSNTRCSVQWCCQPYLSGGGKYIKDPSQVFPLFPDFPPFSRFLATFLLKGGGALCPTLTHGSYATGSVEESCSRPGWIRQNALPELPDTCRLLSWLSWSCTTIIFNQHSCKLQRYESNIQRTQDPMDLRKDHYRPWKTSWKRPNQVNKMLAWYFLSTGALHWAVESHQQNC